MSNVRIYIIFITTFITILFSDSQQFVPKSAFTFQIYEFIPKRKEDYLVHYKNIFLEEQK